MPLTKLEKFAAVTAFIPGISTVTSLIKAFIYYRRSESEKVDKGFIESTATKVGSVAGKVLNVDSEKRKCYKSLWKISMVEAIPGINFIAAIFSAVTLSKLSHLREVNKDSKTQEKYLFEKYELKPIGTPAKDASMVSILMVLDNLEIKDIKGIKKGSGVITTHKNFVSAFAIKKTLIQFLAGFVIGMNQSIDPVKAVKASLQDAIKNQQTIIANLESQIKDNESTSISIAKELFNDKIVKLQHKLEFEQAYLNVLQEALTSMGLIS